MNLAFSIALMIAMACFALGFALAFAVHLRAAHKIPGYWAAQFGSIMKRFAKQYEAGRQALIDENETALGCAANRLLQVGTLLGVLLAMTFGLLRLFGVPIHAL